MSTYLMKITPREPYFFGNEKTFGFPGSNVSEAVNRYYIFGEKIPAQTTVLGTLRYILLPVKKSDYSYDEAERKQNECAVGVKSFCYGEKNTFGKIKNLSPIFLLKGDEILIPTPYDHISGKAVYTPFSDYRSCGLESEKVYAAEFDAKSGVENSYMDLKGNVYSYSDIFKSDTRIGINRNSHDFFKKDFVILDKEFSFGAYVELEDDLVPQNGVAYMGQGKSLFTVSFVPQDKNATKRLYADIASKLSAGVVYCFSDVFVESKVYEYTKGAITDVKEYRAYTTNGKKVEKKSTLYKLIKAGSVFLPSDYDALKKTIADESVEIVGYNQIISKEEKYI